MGTCSSTCVQLQQSTYKKTVPFNVDSRIAVIGGGAGGLHMAFELKKRGYENVTVFEMNKEVGGKAFTIDVDDKSFDTGTVLTYADPLVVDLLKDVGLYKETRVFDVMNTQEYSKLSNRVLSKLDMTKEVAGINCTLQLKLTLKSQLTKFEALYRQMVDKYGFPKEEYISEMVKPVEQFLLDYGLQALGPLVSARLKSQGYDRGDMITFYALFFLDPTFLQPGGVVLEFKSGFGWQDVWTRLVDIHKIDVEYNKRVDAVELVDEQLHLQVQDLSSDTTYTTTYDFCIFAFPNPLKIMTRPSYLQKHVLSKYVHFSPVLTTIYKSEDKHNVSLVFDNKSDYMSEHQTGVALYRKNIKTTETEENQNAGKEDEEVLLQDHHIDVAYVYFDRDYVIKVDEVQAHEEALLKQIQFLTNEDDVTKIHSKINNYYLPHCSPEDVKAGIPWELFKLQGENKMWFTSAITSFDLTQAIINYNMKLLDQYDI